MLRITKPSAPNARNTIVLEGRLVGPWVEELRQVAAESAGGGPATLDLAGLTFADETGVGLLRELRAAGATLAGASGFLAALVGVADHG